MCQDYFRPIPCFEMTNYYISFTYTLRRYDMELDYKQIGKRIAKRRKQLGLSQAKVEEKADLGDKYLSSIERGISIPSTEVVMRLAIALETTPDEFLVGTVRHEDQEWKSVAELLRPMDEKHLKLARSLLSWLAEEEL
ncbi:MAG: helix-turn-helix transcriptional regulator [Ruminiclostridium sp.]|nr:helix-turn-helix transcriptional regulator [Ruminiclostridium sp.]